MKPTNLTLLLDGARNPEELDRSGIKFPSVLPMRSLARPAHSEWALMSTGHKVDYGYELAIHIEKIFDAIGVGRRLSPHIVSGVLYVL